MRAQWSTGNTGTQMEAFAFPSSLSVGQTDQPESSLTHHATGCFPSPSASRVLLHPFPPIRHSTTELEPPCMSGPISGAEDAKVNETHSLLLRSSVKWERFSTGEQSHMSLLITAVTEEESVRCKSVCEGSEVEEGRLGDGP